MRCVFDSTTAYLFRDTIKKLINAETLEYKELIAEADDFEAA